MAGTSARFSHETTIFTAIQPRLLQRMKNSKSQKKYSSKNLSEKQKRNHAECEKQHQLKKLLKQFLKTIKNSNLKQQSETQKSFKNDEKQDFE
ncbi:hypothetical protein [Marichromatium sp. PS1]|uniref:hypothetical protein n=1 Tax=Marichromatium sp. PS1 TaxID=3138932 RepID=UPI0034E86A39